MWALSKGLVTLYILPYILNSYSIYKCDILSIFVPYKVSKRKFIKSIEKVSKFTNVEWDKKYQKCLSKTANIHIPLLLTELSK